MQKDKKKGLSSNKPQNIKKDVKYLLDNPRDIKVGVDKISLTIPFSLGWYQNVSESFRVQSQIEGSSVSISEIKGKGYRYSYRIDAFNRDGNVYKDPVIIQVYPYDKKNAFMRIEYNPSKFPYEKVWADLDALMICVCGYSFREVLSMGTLTGMDFFFDLYGLRVDDFLFDVKYKSKQGIWTKKGRIETYYLGDINRGGFRIYQKDLQDSTFPKNTMRVEACINERISLIELAKIACPFNSLSFYKISRDTGKKTKSERLHVLRWLIAYSKIYGLKNVKKQTPAKILKPYIEELKRDKWELCSHKVWKIALKQGLRSAHLADLRPTVKFIRHYRGGVSEGLVDGFSYSDSDTRSIDASSGPKKKSKTYKSVRVTS